MKDKKNIPHNSQNQGQNQTDSLIEPALIRQPPLPKNFAPNFLALDRGEGCRLFDTAGNRYLDFGSGIAVNALGYGREDLADAAAGQMRKIIHTSNLYTTPATAAYTGQLLQAVNESKDGAGVLAHPASAIHLGSSGTEANEAALTYARLYAHRTRGPGCHKLLYCSNDFHGRTLGALSVTSKEKYKEPYEPLLPGTQEIPLNDTAALEQTLDAAYAAVIVEPLQGEGGINPMDPAFAARLNELCRQHDVLLIADEVQTGMGRTGTLLASPQVGLRPDIITLAKPLAAGLPLSATLIPAKVNDLLHPGDHGTTFGGNPAACAVASRVLSLIAEPDFLAEVRRKSELLQKGLQELAARKPYLGTPRGLGLLQGLPLEPPAPSAGGSAADTGDARRQQLLAVMEAARRRGLLILISGANVLRLAPPLVISDGEIAEGLRILEAALEASLEADRK